MLTAVDGPLTAVMMVHDSRIDRRVLDEARSLAQAGWQVTVIAAPPPEPGYRLDEDLYPDVTIIRLPLHTPPPRLPYPPAFQGVSIDWKTLFAYHDYFYAEALKHPAHVYVAHDLPQLPAALMAALQSGAWLVYDSHELYPEQELFIETGTIGALTDIEKWLAPLADQVITVNRSIAEMMVIRYKIDLPAVILNCPALHQGRALPLPSTRRLHDDLGLAPQHKILLYQGGYSLRRNLQGVIEAMRLVEDPDVVFVLMGPDLEKDHELRQLAERLGVLNQRVFFRAGVSPAELLDFTVSAQAGLIPYHYSELNNYYCTPNKLFEFIVAGLPILANDLPELNRFVSQQGIGLNWPMGTPADIARGIDAFFRSDVAAFQRQAQALSPQYVWEGQGRRVVALYQALLTTTPKARRYQPGPAPAGLAPAEPEAPLEPPPAPRLPPPPTLPTFTLATVPLRSLIGETSHRLKLEVGRRFVRYPPLFAVLRWGYRGVVRPLWRALWGAYDRWQARRSA